MSRLSEHDLHLRSNGQAEPIRVWPVQAVRTRGHQRRHRGLIERLTPLACVLGFVLIVAVAIVGVVVFVSVVPRLLGEVFGR